MHDAGHLAPRLAPDGLGLASNLGPTCSGIFTTVLFFVHKDGLHVLYVMDSDQRVSRSCILYVTFIMLVDGEYCIQCLRTTVCK